MRCPDCGEEHIWSASEAWLEEPTLVPEIQRRLISAGFL